MYYILAAIGTLLIILNIITMVKEMDSFKRHLRAEKKSITRIDIIVGDLRSEFSQTILELQREIIELNEKLELKRKEQTFSSIVNKAVNKVDSNIIQTLQEHEKVRFIPEKNVEKEKTIEKEKKPEASKSKAEEIGDLIKKGMSDEEICSRFAIGKGELLLIKELYLRKSE